MGFSRQEYWSGLPFPSSEDIPDPGIEPELSELQEDSLPSQPPGKPIQLLSHVHLFMPRFPMLHYFPEFA